MGSMRMARRAGMIQAAVATAARMAATTANVTGSVGVTPNSELDNRAEVNQAPTNPRPTPVSSIYSTTTACR